MLNDLIRAIEASKARQFDTPTKIRMSELDFIALKESIKDFMTSPQSATKPTVDRILGVPIETSKSLSKGMYVIEYRGF